MGRVESLQLGQAKVAATACLTVGACIHTALFCCCALRLQGKKAMVLMTIEDLCTVLHALLLPSCFAHFTGQCCHMKTVYPKTDLDR